MYAILSSTSHIFSDQQSKPAFHKRKLCIYISEIYMDEAMRQSQSYLSGKRCFFLRSKGTNSHSCISIYSIHLLPHKERIGKIDFLIFIQKKRGGTGTILFVQYFYFEGIDFRADVPSARLVFWMWCRWQHFSVVHSWAGLSPTCPYLLMWLKDYMFRYIRTCNIKRLFRTLWDIPRVSK